MSLAGFRYLVLADTVMLIFDVSLEPVWPIVMNTGMFNFSLGPRPIHSCCLVLTNRFMLVFGVSLEPM